MAWKPKEKALTPEEAVEQARRDLAPFWFGSAPLLAGVRAADGKAAAHPLDVSFDKRAWLILFSDPTDFGGEALLVYAREWLRRYQSHELSLLLVVRPSFSFLSTLKSVQVCLRKSNDAFPIVLDQGGLITEAFCGARPLLPAGRLLHQRKAIFDHAGPGWAELAEKGIQAFLRLKDPGLALAPPFELPEGFARDAASAELGSRARSAFFRMTGKITQEADRVVVQDPTAIIRFVSAHPRVSIVAQSAGPQHELARIRIDLNGDTVFDGVNAVDLSFGDDGGSELKVTEGRLYHVLQALPEKAREITLRFPDAGRVPVSVYAIRFA